MVEQQFQQHCQQHGTFQSKLIEQNLSRLQHLTACAHQAGTSLQDAAQTQISDALAEAASWQDVPEPAKECIQALLTRDWSERLTAAQLLEHSWITHHGPASQMLLPSSITSTVDDVSN